MATRKHAHICHELSFCDSEFTDFECFFFFFFYFIISRSSLFDSQKNTFKIKVKNRLRGKHSNNYSVFTATCATIQFLQQNLQQCAIAYSHN